MARFRTGWYAVRRGGNIGRALRRGVLTSTSQYRYQAVVLVQHAALAARPVRLCTRHYNEIPTSTNTMAQSSAVPVSIADSVPTCLLPELEFMSVLMLTCRYIFLRCGTALAGYTLAGIDLV